MRSGRRGKGVPAVLLLMLLLTGCQIPGLTPGPRLEPEDTDQALRRMLDEAVYDLEIPGAVLYVGFPDGRSWAGAAGVAEITAQKQPPLVTRPEGRDLQWPPGARIVPELEGRPMTPDMVFRVASIEKTMVATVVLMLDMEGRLGLDDLVEDWLPGMVPGAGRITIRQLLNHTSGLPGYSDDTRFFEAAQKRPGHRWGIDEILAYASLDTPRPAPGQTHRYSNTNYLLAGLIAEKASGRPLAALLRERIFQPLGLTHTMVPSGPDLPGPYAHGYRFDHRRTGLWHDVTMAVDPSSFGAAGALASTAPDLAVWLRALIAGSLLDRTRRREMFTFTPTGDLRRFYGLGVAKLDGAVGHSGDYLFGYQSAMFMVRDVAMVALINGIPMKLGVFDGATDLIARAAKVLNLGWAGPAPRSAGSRRRP